MYRASRSRRSRIPRGAPAEHAAALEVSLGERVLLDGRDVTDEIRSPPCQRAASEVAAIPEVRAALVERQRALIAQGDWVAEGRDIGTVVAPEAEVKVFLRPASTSARTGAPGGLGADVEEVASASRRDRDASRPGVADAVSPLLAAPNAFVLDSAGRSLSTRWLLRSSYLVQQTAQRS